MVYTLAEIIAVGDPEAKDKVLKLNGGEYQSERDYALNRLWGSPPGYIGSEDPRQPGSAAKIVFSKENLDAHRIYYTDRNGQQKSVLIILVDEAEKAGEPFHKAFLAILDKGSLNLANQTQADFRDAVIVYTSNVGNTKVEQRHQQLAPAGETAEDQSQEGAFDEEDKGIFREEFARAFPPEFRGRIQETIVFNHLNTEAVQRIAEMKVREVEEAFAESGIRVGIDLEPEALDWLTRHGYSRSEGARAMEKIIRKRIMEQLIKFDGARDIDVLTTGIHRKRIGVGVSEDGTELEFYFGEGYQLEDFPAKTVGMNDAPAARVVEAKPAREVISTSQPQASQNPDARSRRKVEGPARTHDENVAIRERGAEQLRTAFKNGGIGGANAVRGRLIEEEPGNSELWDYMVKRFEGTEALTKAFQEGGHQQFYKVKQELNQQGIDERQNEWENLLTNLYEKQQSEERRAQQAQVALESRPQQSQVARTPATPEIPKIPPQFKATLLWNLEHPWKGIKGYVSEVKRLAAQGLLDPQAANAQPEIKQAAKERFLNELVSIRGVKGFVAERDQVIQAGIMTAEQINNLPSVREAAKQRLVPLTRNITINAFIKERDQLVAAGIGTVDEWNKLLNETS